MVLVAVVELLLLLLTKYSLGVTYCFLKDVHGRQELIGDAVVKLHLFTYARWHINNTTCQSTVSQCKWRSCL